MASKYTCECGRTALYGEVHACTLQDDYYTTYLMPDGPPYFLTPNRENVISNLLFDRFKQALETISQWDCLNPPRGDLLSDLPWLRSVVDKALGKDKK